MESEYRTLEQNAVLPEIYSSLTVHDQVLVTRFKERVAASRTRKSRENEGMYESTSYLTSTCIPHSFDVGTGLSIVRKQVAAMMNAQREILFVTCFWAASTSLSEFSQALRELNALLEGTGRRIRVRMAFSSLSLFQKLFHTGSAAGKIWKESLWSTKLGLPPKSELSNLDIQVKSLFFRPVSVLHSKFLVIDRTAVILPSSNISWEVWMECAIELRGEIVGKFLQMWETVWGEEGELARTSWTENEIAACTPSLVEASHRGQRVIPTIFLPQPYHQNPGISLKRLVSFILPFFHFTNPPPATPQNLFILEAISCAQSHIFIQTPNLTCTALLDTLFRALENGVDVEIVTCRKMMVLEQLVTAFRTTEFSVSRLISRYKGLLARLRNSSLEDGIKHGKLTVYYFKRIENKIVNEVNVKNAQQSHVKCMIIDNRITVLGSANGDRASFYTSLELNVALFSEDIAISVKSKLGDACVGLLEKFYDCEK